MTNESAGTEGQEYLRLSEVFDTPPETVFEAYTDPDQVTKWWAPHGFEAPREKSRSTFGSAGNSK